MNIKALVKAARLRTLPLALAAVALGAIVSIHFGSHNWAITILAALTGILLQILSNFANDYGDFQSGVDANRTDRTMSSGELSIHQMRKALVVLVMLTLFFGTWLVLISFERITWLSIMFFLIGVLCIAAAYKYTAGKNPYGYRGLGDLAVLIFFGIVPISGLFYLQNPELGYGFYKSLFPATAFGLLSTGVLNINNIRDIDSDRAMGKYTLATYLGISGALWYQLFLILISYALSFWFIHTTSAVSSWVSLLVLPLHLMQWFALRDAVSRNSERERFNKLLKLFVFTNLLLVIVLGLFLLL